MFTRENLIKFCVVGIIGVGIFLAFYLRKPVEVERPPQPVEEVSKPVEEINAKPAAEAQAASTFTVPVDTKSSFNIGIYGESRGDDQAFNSVVASQLLEVFKLQQAKAVFFTGNLISGLEKDSAGKTTKITVQKLTEQLAKFVALYDSILGKDIPFFPAIGDREIAIPGAAQAFIDEFHLAGAKVMDDELAYTVSIGPAFFAVIATEAIAPGKKVVHTFSSEQLSWLSQALASARKTHQYLFVVGHQPAFPSSSTFTVDSVEQRDAFWKILVDNGVSAYFVSQEHLFDRSNRYGVWQVISGGGGAPLSQGGGTNPFYHCLLMSIPPEGEGMPNVKVYDAQGKVVDEFDLKTSQEPLYQMRISYLNQFQLKERPPNPMGLGTT